jgi:hypothetical protein
MDRDAINHIKFTHFKILNTMKQIINYLNSENIKFDTVKNQILLKRTFVNYDLIQVISKAKLKTYELDTIIIIF